MIFVRRSGRLSVIRVSESKVTEIRLYIKIIDLKYIYLHVVIFEKSPAKLCSLDESDIRNSDKVKSKYPFKLPSCDFRLR